MAPQPRSLHDRSRRFKAVCCLGHPPPHVPHTIAHMMANTLPLHEFITLNREEIIRRCRAKVAARSTVPPVDAQFTHGVPMFLDQLVDALRLGLRSTAEIEKSAILHGRELLAQGFTMSEV